MPRPLLICSELSPDEHRQKARGEEDRRASLRMLAIAAAMDGGPRPEAASYSAISDQALRVAIRRYKAEGLSTYTRDDIARIAKERWGIGYHPTSSGRILRGLGLPRQKPRPTQPENDPLAAEAIKKGPADPAEHCG